MVGYNVTSVCIVKCAYLCVLSVFVFLFEVENDFVLWSLTKMAASPVTLHSAWLSLLDLDHSINYKIIII